MNSESSKAVKDVESQDRNYSDVFYQLQDKDYYSIPKAQLNHVHYSKLARPAKYNIDLLKKFDDSRIQSDFQDNMSENQKYYAENGYLILRNFIPNELIEKYLSLREKLNLGRREFASANAYVEYDEILNIAAYQPLMDVIRELHGCEMGLIFTLTAFSSTKRGWHQDAYLDRDDAIPRLASWIACGDVDENCGPFEFVAGSHKWMAMSNIQINEFLKPEYHWPQGHRARQAGVPGWGRISEAFIDPSVYSKIERDGCTVEKFTAKKGDVLLWYGRTMHRGSPPAVEGAVRPGLIGHYAPVFERERGYFATSSEGARYLVPPSLYDTYLAKK